MVGHQFDIEGGMAAVSLRLNIIRRSAVVQLMVMINRMVSL